MLKLKLKEVLLLQGKKHPVAWLQEYCNLNYKKAYNLVHNKQKSIAFEDLSKICMVLECTPDDLYWWDNSSKLKVLEWHPCSSKLTKPDKNPNWAKKLESLDPARAELLKKQVDILMSEKHEEAKKILAKVNKKSNKEASLKEDKPADNTEDSESHER
jgi:putative transcriptional regulator